MRITPFKLKRYVLRYLKEEQDPKKKILDEIIYGTQKLIVADYERTFPWNYRNNPLGLHAAHMGMEEIMKTLEVLGSEKKINCEWLESEGRSTYFVIKKGTNK